MLKDKKFFFRNKEFNAVLVRYNTRLKNIFIEDINRYNI